MEFFIKYFFCALRFVHGLRVFFLLHFHPFPSVIHHSAAQNRIILFHLICTTHKLFMQCTNVFFFVVVVCATKIHIQLLLFDMTRPLTTLMPCTRRKENKQTTENNVISTGPANGMYWHDKDGRNKMELKKTKKKEKKCMSKSFSSICHMSHKTDSQTSCSTLSKCCFSSDIFLLSQFYPIASALQ